MVDLADCVAVEMQFGAVEEAQDRDDSLALKVTQVESYNLGTAVITQYWRHRVTVGGQRYAMRLSCYSHSTKHTIHGDPEKPHIFHSLHKTEWNGCYQNVQKAQL